MDELILALKNNYVKITFKSLLSGNVKTLTYTLIDKPINQSSNSNKIAAFCVETISWDDLEKSTIMEWKIVND